MVKNTETHHFDIQIIHTQYKLKLFGDHVRHLYTEIFVSVFTFQFLFKF